MKMFLTCLALIFACAAALAQDGDQPFLELAKGNSWQYDVVDHGEKGSGKLTVTEVGDDGKLKVKAENLGAGFPEDMTWDMSGDFLVWRTGPEFEWKVLKLKAGRNDAWSGKPNAKSKLTFKSKVAAIEKVTVPAGTFNCLKVETTSEGEENSPVIQMWWAKGVGLVKTETVEFAKKQVTWVLTGYKAGCQVTSEALKKLIEKADVVVHVTIPEKEAGSRKVTAKLACSFKGEPKTEDGRVTIAFPEQAENTKSFKKGDFVVFLKKKGSVFILQYDALPADKLLLDRLTKLVTPPEETLEKLKSLCSRAEIVAGIEVVKLEDRVDFKYHVAKILGAAKGAEGRKHIDIRHVAGANLEKGKKYIVFLSRTEVQGRRMLSPVDATGGVLDYDEGLLGVLKDLCEKAGR